ncbi:Hypothetical predicted protein [Mytilus galloprovincialis]|uniref:Uncharacterized protein n=1 Tax=Mytilus galloprovincialis TaxID=29158 RepID=A0A8B6GF15_MYTGA|nr:Hypothetical predicted protein [Mytilus galloprovincialis]
MAAKMALVVLFGFSLVSIISSQTNFDPMLVTPPHVLVHAATSGDFTMKSNNGDIKIGYNETGKVIFDNEDLNYIIQLILSQPPIWEEHSTFGYIGEFHAGDKIDVNVIAKDPEGQSIVYAIVAGMLPPGVKLEPDSGRIHGLIPDSDATYTITIRATDIHGHFADSVFKIVTRGIIYCTKKPCVNQGVCLDETTGYKCYCPNPYGGLRCEIDCRSNDLVGPTNAKAIPDASLTGYNMYNTYSAKDARWNAGGWYGMDSTSYLQVDLGNVSHIDNFQIKGRSSSPSAYNTGSFYIQHSIDGNIFHNYTSSSNGNVYTFSGTTSSSAHKVNLPEPLDTRFIRFFTLTWNKSYKPYMNMEIHGCHNNS